MSNMRVDSNPVSGLLLGSQSELATELGGDANAQVAAMMLVHARDKSENIRTMRQTERANLRMHQDQQVQKLRKEADEMYMSARAAAYGKIADGCFSIAGGLAMTDQNQVSASASSAGLSGSGRLLSSIGDGISGTHSRKAGHLKADAVAQEHLATESKQRLEELRDEQLDAHKLTRAAIDFLRDVQSSQEQIDRAASFHKA